MINPAAAKAINRFIKGAENPVAGLRIFVSGGGCAGLQYGLRLEQDKAEDDYEFAIDAVMIEDTIRANGLKTREEVTNYTKAGGGCSACHEKIEDVLIAVNGRLYSSEPKPRKAPAESPVKPNLTNYQRIRKIEDTLEAIRPMLQRDHGDVTLIEVDSKKIYLALSGACQGCQMEAATPGGIQHKLVEALGELVQVLPVGALSHA